MSFFAKPISQNTTEDLQDLLTAQAVEKVRLEFKAIDVRATSPE